MSNHYTKISFITLLFLSSINSLAQDYLFNIETIDVEDGLPEREVYSVVADKKGFLWISTQGAISRYDGNQFKTYTNHELHISDYSPTFLAIDDNDNILFVEEKEYSEKNYSGVIDTKTDSIYSLEEYTGGLLKSNGVINLNYASQNPNIWFLTTKQGIIYEYKDGEFKQVYEEKDIFKNNAYYEPINENESWVLQENKLTRLQKNKSKKNYVIGEKKLKFRWATKQDSSIIFNAFSYGNGIDYLEFKNNEFRPYRAKNNLPYQNILHLDETTSTYYLNDSIIIQDLKGQTIFKQNVILEGFINRNYFYKPQNILFITSQNGLIKLNRKQNPFKSYYKGNTIRGLFHKNPFLWISGKMGSKKLNLKTKLAEDIQVEYLANETPFVFANIFKDDNNNLFIGTKHSFLLTFKNEQQRDFYKVENDLEELLVPFKNFKTKKLWVGTNKGLKYLDPNSKKFELIELPTTNIKPGAEIEIRHFYQDDKGIWILSSNGIFLMDSSSETIIKHYTKADGLPHLNLTHLHKDAEGIFWITSKGGGLIRWDLAKNKFQQINQENGLSNNVLYAVYEDEYENLWLPSNYGLMQFDKNNYNTRVYLPRNGLPHEEFNLFAHTQSSDGTLFFGGLNGAISFHPKEIFNKKEVNEIPFYLTKVEILETNEETLKDITKTCLANNSIELDYSYQSLKLEFSLLDYESSAAKQYAYQIEGLQDGWYYTKDNVISLFKLPFGAYNIKIKARSASGVWIENRLQIPLIIKTPFYFQWWFILSIIGLIMVGVFFFIKRREIQFQEDKERLESEVKKRTATIARQTEKLKQLDETKTRFFSNITHEFRTPLTLVIGPLQQLIKLSETKKIQSSLNGVLKNAQNILTLINQLLDISKLESGKMKIEISHGDIKQFTYELINGFHALIQKKNQNIIFETNLKKLEIQFDKDKWNKIIYNLISNAIKFTPQNGNIEVFLTQITRNDSDWISLKVKDSGVGIAAINLPQVFNRFFQIDTSSTRKHEGTGIGLSLVKELVDLMKGKISVASKVQEGSIFTVELPIAEFETNEIEILQSTTKQFLLPTMNLPSESKNVNHQISTNGKKLHLLLIEDNADMLNYIQSCVDKEKYNITTALNGQIGIEKALAIIPDLIVSDIMMPIKDGFEVTTTIRKELATSHIPIILLTAKSTLESKLAGLERGADAYLTKPFSPEELRIRIQKLIELRKKLQVRYLTPNGSQEKETLKFKREDLFIVNLRRYIKNNIRSTNLNGEVLGKQFKFSRMQLHRKLKALTNQSTSEFIQTIRLEMALELLKENKMNISEIAYQTGFSSPNSFSVIFKKKYGRSPKKY
ncbi:MAG: ATP-binding protein [Saprospiraceae bacterium]